MENKNRKLQEKIDALMEDVRLITSDLKDSDDANDEYIYNKYAVLWLELNDAHNTILSIGRAEGKLKK